MLFNSISFAIFLPIVFATYWCLPKRAQWVVLFAASYYFYMSWNVSYVTLILITTAVSYICALALERHTPARAKKICVSLALVVSLGILFVYKYFNFFFDGLNAICSVFAIPLASVTLQLLLPVGISFYTFQTLSYVIDVYRGKVTAERHFGRYATFVSFFPQLVAGPIERTDHLLPQIKAEHRFDYAQASYGAKLMAWGFFKKVVIADTLAAYVDTVYRDLPTHAGFAMMIAMLFFTLQIYCDFSGYSDIAIGVAKLFGIDLMTNFKSPYFATSVAGFWSRWHISLSTWFRDYLYIPLGGNRCSRVKQTRNVLVTFLVSGLWHGANITFVVWGALHGFAQVLENLFVKKDKLARVQQDKKNLLWWVKCGVVFAFCNVAWVFFRADSIADALYFCAHCLDGIANPYAYIMTGLSLLTLWLPELICLAIPILCLVVYDFIQLTQDPIALVSKQRVFVRWPIYIILVVVVLLSPAESSAFVYFQF